MTTPARPGTLGSRHRADPAWYTPSDLPTEVAALMDRDRPAGRPGGVGLLELDLAPVAGTTRVVRHYQRMPLYLFRPIHLDPARPDMAFLYLLQSGEGLVRGDRYRIDVHAMDGAAVHLTSQAATKVFRADADLATQLVHLHAGAGAVLEYLPDPVIPFAGSRFYGRTRVTADLDATVVLGETLLPGRVASGEAHAYDLYWSEVQAFRPDGRLLFTDTLHLAPPVRMPRSPARLGPYDVHATLHVLTRQAPPGELADLLDTALRAQPDVLAAASELPSSAGASARVLGATSSATAAATRAAWDAVRRHLLGAPAPDLRKG
ncbi:urease accessory protein UreD [Blastococcus mobilis]|uniref:Urease accessory protein UreD n=1 Tax=Blastococcus mobilis TaxID=1938746 RepID=A0A238YGM2_9ACTN|nr:urease accessory protein UreD [Blastococcus mobilis]SNR69774.1 urease accessory protein [Blastococcus mobilis]